MDVTDPPEGQVPQPPADIPAPPQPPADLPQAPVPPASWDGPRVAPPADSGGKPKTDVGFFIFGFLSPVVLSVGFSGIVALIQAQFDTLGMTMSVLSGISGLLSLALPVAGLMLFIVGKRNGNIRMWSYGKGVLWAFAVGILIALLAFGTCLISMGSAGY